MQWNNPDCSTAFRTISKADFNSKAKMEILTTNRQNVPTTSGWQSDLKNAFRDLDSLLDYLELKSSEFSDAPPIKSHFPILVPRSFANRMEKGNPRDPLLLQVVNHQKQGNLPGNPWPTAAETWELDPVCDAEFESAPGVLQKYDGRALMVVTGACAIHCRYCFRQNFDYSQAAQHNWEAAIGAIKKDPSISEVILSGGDPLLLSDSKIHDVLTALEDISHVARIRIHTRTPVVLPSRVTADLLGCIQALTKPVWLVLHVNHANEIDPDVELVLEKLHRAGAILLNQAVLLNQINAEFEAQKALCMTLINNRVIPYYLHLLDRVKGAESFLVSDNTGIDLIEKLRTALPGYGVPQLVREIAGNPSKTTVR